MLSPQTFEIYAGNGQSLTDRQTTLPAFSETDWRDNPKQYLASPGLKAAVNVALGLGQPLLLTGDPGTGKSQLAGSVAYELELPLEKFFAKTTAVARDLFYRYDALGHFHARKAGEDDHKTADVRDYVFPEALGRAILRSIKDGEARKWLAPQEQGEAPKRSVVLIDEIDKAPRDLPNDILNELERMSFTIHETRQTFQAEPQFRPIIILTSNSEKNLPEPFLRRCVYYHIPPPTPDDLKAIVRRRAPLPAEFTDEMLYHAIGLFTRIRDVQVKKKAATAEFLAWLDVLISFAVDVDAPTPKQKEVLDASYSILAKAQEDLARVRSLRK